MSIFRKRPIYVIMNQHNQSDLAGEVQDPVQRRVGQARNRTGDLAGYELLVNAELANTGEYARKSSQHAANMIHRVHIGWIEARDHGIKPCLLLRLERLVSHGDPGIGEGVVVQGGVGVEVILRRAIRVDPVRPKLL